MTTSQQIFTGSTIATFDVTRGKYIAAVVNQKLELFNHDKTDVDEPFRSLVGHLMCLANQTRPDICNAVRAMARHYAAPKLLHWLAAVHIVLYIKSRSTYGISFQRGMGNGVTVELCVDAGCANDANDRRSISCGFIICAGVRVSFYFKPITLSSTEAEYVAMATGFRETIVMRYLLILFFPDRDVGCTTVKEENEGAIHLSKKSL